MCDSYKVMERGKIERGIQRERDGGREAGLDVESESERETGLSGQTSR